MPEKNISIGILVETCKNNRFWAWACLLTFLLLETFFFFFPPRGYIAEDMIIAGSIRGQTLISVEHLWEKIVSDDQFMLEVLADAKISELHDKKEQLDFLNEVVRKNLKFLPVNQVLFRISFILPTAKGVREFLNTFTQRFVAELSLLSEDELALRRERVDFQYEQLFRRVLMIHSLLAPEMPIEEIVPDKNGFNTNFKTLSFSGRSFLRKSAMAVINELSRDLFAARIHQMNHNDHNQKILRLYPFSAVRLSDSSSPPKPVQPYLVVFYFSILVSVFLVFLAGLVYLIPEQSNPANS